MYTSAAASKLFRQIWSLLICICIAADTESSCFVPRAPGHCGSRKKMKTEVLYEGVFKCSQTNLHMLCTDVSCVMQGLI